MIRKTRHSPAAISRTNRIARISPTDQRERRTEQRIHGFQLNRAEEKPLWPGLHGLRADGQALSAARPAALEAPQSEAATALDNERARSLPLAKADALRLPPPKFAARRLGRTWHSEQESQRRPLVASSFPLGFIRHPRHPWFQLVLQVRCSNSWPPAWQPVHCLLKRNCAGLRKDSAIEPPTVNR
jgi:hypothetical protein